MYNTEPFQQSSCSGSTRGTESGHTMLRKNMSTVIMAVVLFKIANFNFDSKASAVLALGVDVNLAVRIDFVRSPY